MDDRETTAFWRQAWMSEHERPLTPVEEEFVDASVRHTSDRWSGECDVERMAALVERHPSLLETIGPAVLNIAAYRGGCAPALEFLLDRGLVFSVAEHRARGGKESEYDIVHEGRLGRLHRQPAPPPRARHGRRQEHLEPAHRLARQRLPPLLGGHPAGRRGPHPAAAGARRRSRGEVQGQRRARVHSPAGSLRARQEQPRRNRPGPDRPRRPLRRVFRQRPGRPRPPAGVCARRARRGAVPGRGGHDPPPLGRPRRRAALRQVAAEPRSGRRRADGGGGAPPCTWPAPRCCGCWPGRAPT